MAGYYSCHEFLWWESASITARPPAATMRRGAISSQLPVIGGLQGARGLRSFVSPAAQPSPRRGFRRSRKERLRNNPKIAQHVYSAVQVAEFCMNWLSGQADPRTGYVGSWDKLFKQQRQKATNGFYFGITSLLNILVSARSGFSFNPLNPQPKALNPNASGPHHKPSTLHPKP